MSIRTSLPCPASICRSSRAATRKVPWGYLTTNYSSQALNYHGIAYVATPSYALGTSPQLPNHNFEVYGVLYGTAPNGIDADPSQVLTDFLTNAVYGAGFPGARVATPTVWQAYCLANGLWISPAYNQQSTASSIIDDLGTATNGAPVWSNGQLSMIPYGDQAITANGYTYTPPSSPLYSLTDDDFMKNQGTASNSDCTDPVLMVRKRPADTINDIKIEALDRTNQYNPAVVESKDQALIDVYGLRSNSTKQLHLFCDLNAAQLSATLQLQRQQIRNQYTFTLDQRYITLDPMDIIEISDSYLGLNQQWVRILEITENDDYTLTFTAEEYLAGNGSAPLYSFQENNGYNGNYNSSPGNANTPVLFEPPIEISYSGSLEVDIACSGGSNWGGCNVYISSDGSTYKLAGRVNGPARVGQLTASLPAGTDPDTTDTLAVNLSPSFGSLISGTQSDADDYHTLCYCDGEYVSYETATLTSAYNYNLTYLRRGAYGSAIAAHSSGAHFVRMDDGVFAYPYSKSQIGLTIYIKLVSFNIFGGGLQAISSVTPTTYTIQGTPLPATVQNFSVQQQGSNVVFSWTDLLDFDSLKGYDLLYGPQGGSPSNATMITEASRATEMTTASIPPGTWTFYICGHDIADQTGPYSMANLTVVNVNDVIDQQFNEPGWLGTLSGFLLHYTGVLVPDSTKQANAMTNAQLVRAIRAISGQQSDLHVASAGYRVQQHLQGLGDDRRLDGTGYLRLAQPRLRAGLLGQPGERSRHLLSLDHRPSDRRVCEREDHDEHSDCVLCVRFRSLHRYLCRFADEQQLRGRIERHDLDLSRAPFHSAPNVQVTPTSAGATSGSATSVTATSAFIQLWNGTTEVSGTANLSASGV